MHRLFLILILLMPAGVSAELDISDAWIKNLPPSVPVRAGYMTLRNPQSQAQSIVAIRSEAFMTVEIHQTVSENGMMRMDPIGVLKIEADAELRLAPGGIHLMMMQPQEATRPGDRIRITLEFENGSTQRLEMTVRK